MNHDYYYLVIKQISKATVSQNEIVSLLHLCSYPGLEQAESSEGWCSEMCLHHSTISLNRYKSKTAEILLFLHSTKFVSETTHAFSTQFSSTSIS